MHAPLMLWDVQRDQCFYSQKTSCSDQTKVNGQKSNQTPAHVPLHPSIVTIPCAWPCVDLNPVLTECCDASTFGAMHCLVNLVDDVYRIPGPPTRRGKEKKTTKMELIKKYN